MDDYQGQNPDPGAPPAPDAPPTPAYQPPAPPVPPAPQPTYTPPPAPPVPPAPQAYAPQPGYEQQPAAPVTPPKKKKTWLWIVLSIVILGLLGCCIAAAVGGFALFQAGAEPQASIEAINQAGLDGDTAAFEKYFDTDSVATAAYDSFIEYMKTTDDYAALVEQAGEAEADRAVREDLFPKEKTIEELKSTFSLEGMEDGAVPFPEYEVKSTNIDNDTAELTITTVEESGDMEYVLEMKKEKVGDEEIWRVKRIKNVADLLAKAMESEPAQ